MLKLWNHNKMLQNNRISGRALKMLHLQLFKSSLTETDNEKRLESLLHI